MLYVHLNMQNQKFFGTEVGCQYNRCSWSVHIKTFRRYWDENYWCKVRKKPFEILLTNEERICSEDLGDFFRVTPNGRDLN